jgi:hypothetical protein
VPEELISLDEFERRLTDLVATSARNGIDFDRSWTVRPSEDGNADVMVEITYLDDVDGRGSPVATENVPDARL